MSTGPKVAAFAVLLRILYGAYPQLHAHWLLLVWIMAALSMTVGNLGALRQQNVKRMLAYSSIAHAGYTLVAFTALSEGIAAAMFYTASYAAMNVGAFAVISHAGGYDEKLLSVADYRGLAYRSPLLGGALASFCSRSLVYLSPAAFSASFMSSPRHCIPVRCGWLSSACQQRRSPYYYYRLLTSVYAKPADDAPVQLVPRLRSSLTLALLLTVFRHRHPGHLSRPDFCRWPEPTRPSLR